MPRFYFDLRHRPGPAGLAVDTEGEELPDFDAARDRALDAARDHIARTRTDLIRDWFVCAFEIRHGDRRDGVTRAALTVPFSDAVPEVDYG